MKPVHVSLSRERVGVRWRVLSVSIGSGAGDSGLAPASARAELATQRGMTRRSEQTDLKPEKADKRIHSETESDRLLATDRFKTDRVYRRPCQSGFLEVARTAFPARWSLPAVFAIGVCLRPPVSGEHWALLVLRANRPARPLGW